MHRTRHTVILSSLAALLASGMLVASVGTDAPADTANTTRSAPGRAADVRTAVETSIPPDADAATVALDEEAQFDDGTFAGLGDYDNPADGMGGGADTGGGGPVDIPPGPTAEPHPCDSLTTGGGSLVVRPDPVHLDSNDTDGEFQVINCGNADVEWAAAVNPKVTLSATAGTVTPGQAAVIGFTIDFDAYGDGAIDVKIKVTEPGRSHYVDVHAFNPAIGLDAVGGNGTLSAGEGVGGCGNQCVVSASLRANVQSPNASLDVVTDTPARVRVWVSKNAPQIANGVPSFPGVNPVAVSDPAITRWTAALKPLQWSTTYFIIVSGTDADGDVSYRHGSFRTRAPVEAPGGMVDAGGPSGCAAQCINSAVVTPGADVSVTKLAVTSHTPALFQASVSTGAPSFNGSVPSFTTADEWVNSGLQYRTIWNPTLAGLAADTTYHIIVQATDAKGRRSYRVGQFRTAAEPTVSLKYTMLGIKVTDDGDKHSAGELDFGWQVGGNLVAFQNAGTIDDAFYGLYTFRFPQWSSTWVVEGIAGFMPSVIVTAHEFDYQPKLFGKSGCGDVPKAPTSKGFDADCAMKWNIAASGIVRVDTLDDLSPCTDHPQFEGAGTGMRCMLLSSDELGDDYPSIEALVAVSVA